MLRPSSTRLRYFFWMSMFLGVTGLYRLHEKVLKRRGSATAAEEQAIQRSQLICQTLFSQVDTLSLSVTRFGTKSLQIECSDKRGQDLAYLLWHSGKLLMAGIDQSQYSVNGSLRRQSLLTESQVKELSASWLRLETMGSTTTPARYHPLSAPYRSDYFAWTRWGVGEKRAFIKIEPHTGDLIEAEFWTQTSDLPLAPTSDPYAVGSDREP